MLCAVANSSDVMRPLAIVLHTRTAYSSSGRSTSDVYVAAPLTFNSPSMRVCARPITDSMVSLTVDMAKSYRRSIVAGSLRQRMHDAPARELDLEAVLALRPRIGERRIGGPRKRRGIRRRAGQHSLGFSRMPRL